MTGECYHVEPKNLRIYRKEIFMGHGLSEEDVKVAAVSLAAADLRNMIPHGVVRVGNYVDRLKQGGAKAIPMAREKAAVHGTAYGVECIYVPGEIENTSKDRKEKNGLEIHINLLDSLIDPGKEAGLGETRSAFFKIKPVK
jgi:LDH2 family malate/lactate/ureidoglycolate dehydrogenase